MSCLLSWTEISMIIALEQARFFFFFFFSSLKRKKEDHVPLLSLSLSPTHSISPLHPTTSSLPIIPIIITTTPFLLPPLPNIPIIHSCSSNFHCLFPRKTPLVPYPPSKKKTKDKSRNFVINGTYRNLLPQKINIIFTICQTLLCRVEFGNQEGFGFREGVGEHDVCLITL